MTRNRSQRLLNRSLPSRAAGRAACLVTWLALGLALGCAHLRSPKPALPQSYPVALQYDSSQIHIEPIQLQGKAYIRLRHPAVIGSTRDVGRPALPQAEVFVVLPPDAANVRVTLQAASSVTVAHDARVEPLQPPVQTSTPQFSPDGLPLERFFPTPPVVVDEAAYASDAPYPVDIAALEGVTTRYGAKVATLRISPLVFYPRQERTDLRTSLTGAVTFESALPPRNLYPELPAAQREALLRTVVNPGVLAIPSPSTPAASLASHGDYVVPDVRPAKHDNVPYVVITRAALAGAFQPLVDWKTRKGVQARVVTAEWIETRYPGVDLANKVRNFILDARARWGTSWVLLGGDVDQVPARLAFYDSTTSSYGPTDLYFSGLGGNWNANGNHVFGDAGEPDLDPDLFVGRAPVANASEVAVFVNKALLYEQSPPAGYVESALLMGVRDNLSSDSDKENDIKPLLPAGFTVTRMYDSASPLAPDVIFNQANTIARVNQRYHILNHMDHSGIQGMGTGSHSGGGGVGNNDVDGLTNGLPGSILWTYGCEPNAFDYDSISEHWMRNQHGGTVAFVGNTRTGWPGQSAQDDQFFQSWFTNKVRHLGTLLSTTQGSFFDPYDVCNMNLLGDPEMVVWSAQPTLLTVGGLPAITTGANPLHLTVGGLAAGEEATVTFRGPAGQVYASGQTVGGVLNGTLVAHTAVPLDLTVTSPDRLPFSTPVPVSVSASAHLYVSGAQVIDTLGNGNQQLEPGESAVLRVTLSNGGGAASVAGTATIAPSTSGVSLSGAVQPLPALPPGGSQTVDFSLTLANSFSDGDALLFDLATQGAAVEHTDVHVPVFAPVLEQTHIYDDTAGNGNGVPEAGETVEFGLHVINNGFGDASAVTAKLTADTGAVTVTNGTITIGNVPAKTDANSGSTFKMILGGTFNPSVDSVTLTMTDSLGNTWTRTLELVVPAPPAGLTYRSTATSITPLWDAAIQPADRNYKIYRSLAAGGPYSKIATFLVRDGALYEDTTISTSQPSYFYRIAIVDAFGNESPAAQVQSWTSLPSLSGFPRPVLPADGAITGHTEAFDLFGDGQKEIFATTAATLTGPGQLYAWKSDGNELISRGDPNFAEFATLDGPNYGAPAFADLDGDGQPDIIVNGAYRVYAFKADGSPVAGWAGGVAIPTPDPCMTDPPAVDNTSPAAVDLDGDGWPEVITTAYDWGHYCDGNSGHVYVIDHTGNIIAAHHLANANYSFATPAFGDLDGNGGVSAVIPFSTGKIYRLDNGGTSLSLIVAVPGAIFPNEASLADLDGDGKLDIIVASQLDLNAPSPNADRVFAFHLDGTPVPGWAGGLALDAGDHVINQFGYSSAIAVADVDCDGKPEVALGTEQHVYLWGHDGQRKAGWPVVRENKTGVTASAASPLIADIDGDGQLDVVISTSLLANGGAVYAWNGKTGAAINGFPQSIGDTVPRTGTVADIDGDGLLEVVQGAGPHMYAFKTTGHAQDALLPWANVHRDAVHSSALLPADLGNACCTPPPAGALALYAGTGDGYAAFSPDETGDIFSCGSGSGNPNLNGIRFDPAGPLPAANFNCGTTLYVFDQAGTRRQVLGVHAAPRNTCACTFPPAAGGPCFYEPLCTANDVAHITCSDLISDSGVILAGGFPTRRITDFGLPNFPGLKVHLIQEAFQDHLEQTYQFTNTSANTYNLRLARVADLDVGYLDDGTATGTPVPSPGGYIHNIPGFVPFGAEVHDNVKTGSTSTPAVRVLVTAPQGSGIDATFEGARLQGDGGSSHGRAWWNYGVPPFELGIYGIDGSYWTVTWTGDPAPPAESDQAVTVQSLLTIPPGQTRTYVTRTLLQ
jgi:Peptidase family C25/FG-GAP-like repeat/FG-GAP repeat